MADITDTMKVGEVVLAVVAETGEVVTARATNDGTKIVVRKYLRGLLVESNVTDV